jgi:hypothetical protein
MGSGFDGRHYNGDLKEAISKSGGSGVLWFDKLTTNGTNPFVLSLSEGLTRPSLLLDWFMESTVSTSVDSFHSPC